MKALTKEQAAALAKVLSRADDGCETCVSKLCDVATNTGLGWRFWTADEFWDSSEVWLEEVE